MPSLDPLSSIRSQLAALNQDLNALRVEHDRLKKSVDYDSPLNREQKKNNIEQEKSNSNARESNRTQARDNKDQADWNRRHKEEARNTWTAVKEMYDELERHNKQERHWQQGQQLPQVQEVREVPQAQHHVR